jgi:type IV pilus assembly protein PilC
MSSIFTRLSIKEKTLFAKRLSFLIKAGVPILESLRIMRRQASGARSKVLDQVIADVSNGQFLSTSLAKFEDNFDQFAINIIKIGEESGTLDENLTYLADELKKKQNLRSKVLSAMIYPIFIISATLGISGLLIIYIFPKILPVFASLNVHLPITTRILIWAGHFLSMYGIYLVSALIGLLVFLIFLMRNSKFKLLIHEIILKLPLTGSISQNYHMANFCRTLGLLLKSDVRIVRAFSISAETTSNLVYRRELEKIAQNVTTGEKITTYMEKHPKLFPHVLTELLSIGEATGKLDETLTYLSEMYEAEVEELTKNLSTILEPALMVFMGIIVGFIAVSIITPIYEITQNLTPR